MHSLCHSILIRFTCILCLCHDCLAVVAEIDDAVSVNVEEEDVRYGAKGYVVVMNFASGYSLGVTETAVIGDRGYVHFHSSLHM